MVNRVCSMPITQQVLFPVFLFFPSFSFDSFESPWLVTYFGMCWGMLFSISPFGSSPFAFFPIWAESHSADLKVTCCHSPFRISPFWFLEMLPTCAMIGHLLFLLFLVGLLALVASTLFLIFFSCPFLSSYLNLPLTVLMHLEGSAPLGDCWGS